MVSRPLPRFHSSFLTRLSSLCAAALLSVSCLFAATPDSGPPAADSAVKTQAAAPAAPRPEASGPATPKRSEGGSVFDYKIGDVATEEVIAPVSMVVIDPEETIALKQAEAARVQVICRYYTNKAAQVEERFRSAYVTTRSNFLDTVDGAFNNPVLNAQNIASPKFVRLVANFQRRKGFPVSTNTAELWARGESDRVMLSSLTARLREAMIRPIRAGGNPLPKLTFTVRIVTMADEDPPLTLEDAEKRGRNSPRANIVTLNKARTDLIESFPPEDQVVGKFLASLLKTNLVVDNDLTDQARAKRTDPLWAADRYEAGQVIVKPGQVIDRKIKAALNHLREKAAIGSLQERVQAERSNALMAEERAHAERSNARIAEERAQNERFNTRQAELHNRWLFAGLLILLCLLVLVFLVARRKPAPSLLPATVPKGPVLALPHTDHAEVRERLIPHLARFLTGTFVQKLISQRTDLIDTQKKAAAEMTELEDRLEKVHAPLQDRLRAYQQRIAELEKELVSKGEENRQLTKAKIELARKHLAATQNQLDLN